MRVFLLNSNLVAAYIDYICLFIIGSSPLCDYVNYSIFSSICALNNPATVVAFSSINLKESVSKIDSEYIQQFWVGLLDGDGTITVDKNGNSLRVRIIISLKNSEENVFMLNLIKDHIGGRVVIERKNQYVTWIASNKNDLVKVMAILAKYPLLTTRKQCQLQFAKQCLICPDAKNFIRDRNNKYSDQEKLVAFYNQNFTPPFYFKSWLSGFIESEGNFSLVLKPNGKINKASFSIGQNTDRFLLEMIRTYFESSHKILEERSKSGVFKYYRLSIYGPKSRNLLEKHFSIYPLLGSKAVSYFNWINYFKQRDEVHLKIFYVIRAPPP